MNENIILFDDDYWQALLPLTYTRPIGELRVGILKISEKWSYRIGGTISYITQDYLAEKYPINISDNNLVINARLLPNDNISNLIVQLEFNEALLFGETLIAARLNRQQFDNLIAEKALDELKGIDITKYEKYLHLLSKPYDIFLENSQEIGKDYKILTYNRNSRQISYHNYPINPENIFIAEDAEVTFSSLNATDGPIYIGKGAKVMEGAHIRGPFALCENAVVKMGTRIYGGTTIGPYSKVGGELSNVVMQGYSNKGHDGYLGNSVLGEWCNLGADTNCSNLKNNYTEVKVWSYESESFKKSGLQFCGLIMGDHSKTGINTMINTGTVVGVSANIFGSGFPRNFIPSYSWGGNAGYSSYLLDKAYDTMSKVMERRNKTLEEMDKIILGHIYHSSATYRRWE